MPTEADESPRPDLTPRLSTDRLLAFSAVFLSLAALVVAIFQTAILREQQRASVWPFLQLDAQIDEPDYTYSLSNYGVGPARILGTEVRVGGREYPGFEVLMREIIAEAGGPDSIGAFGWYFEEVEPGEVVPVEGTIHLIQTLHSQDLLTRVRDVLKSEDTRIRIRYADVYGNEWELLDGQVREL